MKSSTVLARNIANVAGFPDVKFQDGGSSVIMASCELSKRIRNRSSLAPSASSVRLRSVKSVTKFNVAGRPSQLMRTAVICAQRILPERSTIRNA